MSLKSIIFLLISSFFIYSIQGQTEWKEEFNGPYKSWLNVKDFGAEGDGKTDDTQAIKKALAKLVKNKRKGVLYFPSGDYKISETLEFASSDKKLNPGKPGKRGAVGKVILGQNPENTIIKWAGKEGGTMLHLAGQTQCRYGRLTFDGSEKAQICIRVEKNSEIYRNSSYVQIHDMIFKGAAFGIYNTDYDKKHDMDAEYSILRCTFYGMTDAGIRIDAGNAYDYWIRHCRFEDCSRGVINTWGDFYVLQSNFLRSKDCDIVVKKHRSGTARGCYSKGSKQFIRIKNGRFLVADNTIVDPAGDTAISYKRHARYESVLVLDNKISADKAEDTALIKIESGKLDTPVALIGNYLNVKNSIKSKPDCTISIENKFAEESSFFDSLCFWSDADTEHDFSELPLPQTPKQIKRKVFDAANCNELKTQIAKAVEYYKANPESRPVVHLEPSESKTKDFFVIPPNIPLKLVGDGFTSFIRGSKRTIAKPKLLLQGPSRVRIQDIVFQYGGKLKDGSPASPVADILIDNADQKGSQIITENIWGSGVFADRLKNTKIDLLDHYSSSYGPFLRTTLKVTGSPENSQSRVAMFSGVVIGDQIQAHVLDGGKLIMEDFWHEENGPMTHPWALLAGKGANKGEFNLISAMVYQQSKRPIIEVNAFDGNFTAVNNLILGHSQYVKFREPCENTSFLSLFGCLQMAKHSPRPENSLMIDKVSPNSKPIDPEFILKLLEFSRKTKAERIVKPTAKGTTDVRMNRIMAKYQNGWGIWVKPEKHESEGVGVSVEASDWDASEGIDKSGNFLFSRDSCDGELTVSYRIDGDIDSNDIKEPLFGKITFSDKAKHVNLTISPIKDNIKEAAEMIKVRILPGEKYSIGTNRQCTRDYIVIQDTDTVPDLKVSIIDNTAAETDKLLTANTAKIRFERNLSAGDLTVQYALTGKLSSKEFKNNINGKIVIPNGKNEAILELIPFNDSLYEPEKKIKIVLKKSENYNILPFAKTNLTIYDNDVLDLNITKRKDGFLITRNCVSGKMEIAYSLTFTADSRKKEKASTTTETASFADRETSIFIKAPSDKKGIWELKLAPIPASTMDDVILPDSASRYWWVVSEKAIIAIDLQQSEWGSSKKPGKPHIFKHIAIPAEVQKTGKWITSKTKSEEISVSYDPAEDSLWVMKMADKTNPQTLWKISRISKLPEFRTWVTGSVKATGKAPALRLCPKSKIATEFASDTSFWGFVDKKTPVGQLAENLSRLSMSVPIMLSDKNIFANKKGKCYRWDNISNMNIKNGIHFGDAGGIGDPLSPIPKQTSRLLELENAIMLFKNFSNFTIYSEGEEKDYTGEDKGYMIKAYWDSWGRVWVQPFSWKKSAVILDPLNNFKEETQVKGFNSKKGIAFDNKYAYILDLGKKPGITRMLLSGEAWRQHISLSYIENFNQYRFTPKTDPTGCHWFIQNYSASKNTATLRIKQL